MSFKRVPNQNGILETKAYVVELLEGERNTPIKPENAYYVVDS